MIAYINENRADEYHLLYSTPSKYIAAVNKLAKKWPVKYDDMMPYSNSPHAYWTGYFSSRANSKSEVRRGSNILHASNQLYALASITGDMVAN